MMPCAWCVRHPFRVAHEPPIPVRCAGVDSRCQDPGDREAVLRQAQAEPSRTPMAREQQHGVSTGHYDPRNPVHRRQKRLFDLARAVTVGWLGHPAVAREVAAAKPVLESLVEPLGLPDQYVVSLVVARFLDAAPYWADGTEWPNPFNFVSEAVREEGARIGPLFVEELRRLAMRIEPAGAPLDPADLGGLLVLAQLALLEPDLTRPAGALADDLNLLPPGWIEREAAARGHLVTHTSRHGRNARFEADLAASAEFVTRRLGPPAIHPPYSGGRRRRPPLATLRLRAALSEIAKQHPTLTASQLLGLKAGSDHPAMTRLCEILCCNLDDLPDQRTIERNWPKSRRRKR
jgi:hypothetical protein